MSYNFLGIDFFDSSRNDLIVEIKKIINGQEQKYIVTPNSEILLLAEQDKSFKSILQQADIALPDGIGILWASWFLSLPRRFIIFKPLFVIYTILQWMISGILIIFKPRGLFQQIKTRLSGSDIVLDILRLSEEQKIRVGGLLRAGGLTTITTMEQKIKRNYPNINCKLWETQNFDDYSLSINKISEINEFSPQIMLVAIGAPRQEKLIARYLRDWPSVKIAMGVGGTFDFITERKIRAPKSWQLMGIEWLWRLIIQPNRILRIYRAVFKFSWMVVKIKILDTKY